MAKFRVDLTLFASVQVEAPDETTARRLIDEHIHGASANLGAWPNGDPILTEVSLDDDGPDSVELEENHHG